MEEWMIYFGLAGIIALILLIITFIQTRKPKNQEQKPNAQNNRAEAGGRRPGGNARVANVRNRRAPVRRVDDSDSENENEAGGPRAQAGHSGHHEAENALLNDPKLGAKKRAKLEAKAEKRAQREVEERLRREKNLKEMSEMLERREREKQEELEEKQKEEEEKRLREEQAQRELEEYIKMKEAFTVEQEGCEVLDTEEDENLIEKFISHIKEKKVILFEELATTFGLKVPDTIDRLNTLVKEGRITGVMDDRGKFIYISESELNKFAKFIKQRGRVSIVELMENSSDIVNLLVDTSSTKGVVDVGSS